MSEEALTYSPAPQTPGAPKTETDALPRLKRMLDDCRTTLQQARLDSGIDRDYYDGHQLTAPEVAVLRVRGQPALVINRVRRGIDGILGIAEQARTDPRAYMRNPPDPGQKGPQQPSPMANGPLGQPQPGQPVMGGNGGPAMQPEPEPELDAADVATMTLRYVADQNHFKATKQDVLENGLIEGDGAAIIEYSGNQITVTQIRWEEFFYDPRSRRPDFGDARYMGVAKWMYADQASLLYPEKKVEIDAFSSGATGGLNAFDSSWEDRPNNITPWVDLKQRRMVVVEVYYQEGGEWLRCVYFANGILEPAAPSPYLDDKKQTVCPIEAWSCYVDRENRRYGAVRDMRGPQDEINMRRSKLLHMVNVRQIQQVDPNAPPVDAATAKAEAAKPDGIIPAGWQMVPDSGRAQGQAELLAEAKSEIERMGPSPAILGRQGADASGRAVQLRQQAGMTEFARVLGRFSDWELRCYKQMWARARQFFTDPMWIRVTNDENTPKYVRINEPQGAEIATDPNTGQPVPHPETGGPMLIPKLKNHIAEMDVDIVVDMVPDTATLQQEIFSDLTELAKVYGPQAVPFEVMIEMSPLPRKRELIDKIAAARKTAAAANAPAMQLKATETQAGIAVDTATAALKTAQAGLVEVETVVEAMAGHVIANSAAQLPPGYTLGPNGEHLPLQPPLPIAASVPPPSQ